MNLPQGPLTRRGRTLAVAALLAVFAVHLLVVAHLYSATWDEPHHLYDGYTIWTKHDYRLNPEVPPLVKLVAALPLLPMHLAAPRNQGRFVPMEAFLGGRAFVFGNGGDRVLLPSRMACMAFTLMLAWLLYAAARAMFGTLPAFLALSLFVFDPNVLAHGTLITTDVGSSCCIFGAVYAFYRYTRKPSAIGFAIAAVAAGLALVAKFTGVLIVPILILLVHAEAARTRDLAAFRRQILSCAGIFACAWIVLWAFYGFRYKPSSNGLELAPQLAPYLQRLPSHRDASALALIARYKLLPEPYIWGLANTRLTEMQFTSYFFGHIYRHGPWQYFPAAFLIKSTLPLLILLLLSSFLLRRLLDRHARELVFLLIPVAVYFFVATMSHFDIGARHLLPIYPFLYILAAATAAAALRRGGPLWTTAVAALLVSQAVTAARTFPAYIAYGNEAWGGPSQVRRYLSDANVDWGQQLKEVKRYLDQNHIDNCWFAYAPDGPIEPSDYGIHCRRLPTTSSLWWLNLPMDVPPVIDGTILISDDELEGIDFGDGRLNPYNSFRGIEPVTVIQHGVSVYQGRFHVPLASALVDVRRSGDAAKTGDLAAALAIASTAVTLAPDSAIVQLNLAEDLAAGAQWSAALEHYQSADYLAHTIRPDLQGETLFPKIAAGLAASRSHL